ncbi:MAG: hypothetical protein R3E39_31695 [Anaerolineae bacterium]
MPKRYMNRQLLPTFSCKERLLQLSINNSGHIVAVMLLLFTVMIAACQPQVTTLDPALETRIRDERATLPAVTTVEKWTLANIISNADNSAPSIVPLIDGDYRIYWTAPSLNGIGSATTPDGALFNVDDGARIINAPSGQPDCTIGKPWLVQLADGYRMYFEGRPEPCSVKSPDALTPGTRIFSATSTDGRSFSREAGVRIDIDPASGLSAAGHGRVIQKDDGSFLMYFTVLRTGQENLPVILSAISIDGLLWQINPQPLLENAHDPTALQIDDTIYLYVNYMTANVLVLTSGDGIAFSPAKWLEFYNDKGQRLTNIADVDVLDTPDGQFYLYANGDGTNGVAVFKQTSAS